MKCHMNFIRFYTVCYSILGNRPSDKSVYWNFFFLYFSSKTYVVGTQKNRLNETVLLSTKNTCLN